MSGDVAAGAASRAIDRDAHVRALRRHHSIVAHGAIRQSHGRSELDLATHRVEHEMTVAGTTGREIRTLGPLGPVITRFVDLDHKWCFAGDDRLVLELEPLAG